MNQTALAVANNLDQDKVRYDSPEYYKVEHCKVVENCTVPVVDCKAVSYMAVVVGRIRL